MQKALANLRVAAQALFLLAAPLWLLQGGFYMNRIYGVLALAAIIGIWQCVGPYRFAATGPCPQTAKARYLSSLAIRHSLVAAASVLVLCIALLFMLVPSFIGETPAETLGYIGGGLAALFGILAFSLVFPPVGFFLALAFGIVAVLAVLLLLLCFAPPCVLGVRAVNAAYHGNAIPKPARVVYTIFMCLPAVSLVPLIVLHVQLRKGEQGTARPGA